jgi:hypothetical protein
MAKMVLTDAYLGFVVGGGTIVFSDHANKITITQDIDDVEVTTFGPSGFKEYAQGMADASISVTLYQDFALTPTGGSASYDATLYNLYTGRGTFGVVVKPTSSAKGTANPEYNMTARLYNYTPLDGSAGDASTIDCTLRNAGTAGITRGTA